MKRALLLLAAIAVAPLAFSHDEHSAHGSPAKAQDAPYGRPADPAKAARTIRVAMTDEMRFHPAELTVKRGEVVRFVPVNKGQVLHEMVLGTMDDLKKHAELMRKHPGMEHDEPHMAHVSPGKSGEIGWHFTQSGEFYYGCLIPGHLEAGMVGRITVEP